MNALILLHITQWFGGNKWKKKKKKAFFFSFQEQEGLKQLSKEVIYKKYMIWTIHTEMTSVMEVFLETYQYPSVLKPSVLEARRYICTNRTTVVWRIFAFIPLIHKHVVSCSSSSEYTCTLQGGSNFELVNALRPEKQTNKQNPNVSQMCW